MSDILSIGGSAIAAYQKALGTVSNNIANLNTNGYSREEVTLSPSTPENRANIYLGTGVVVDGVKRAYSDFAASSLRSSFSALNTQEPLVQYSNRIVDVMGSAKSSLTTALDHFFSSARAVSASPASSDMRTQFMSGADGVAATFREISGQLQSVETDTRESIQSSLGQINTIAAQLVTVNAQLRQNSKTAGQSPVLLDQRDQLLTELSKLTRISAGFTSNGEVTVALGSSVNQSVFLNGTDRQMVGAQFSDNAAGKVDIVIDPYGKPQAVSNLEGGTLSGLIAFRQQSLEPTQSRLDTLAQVFATEVNAIQTSGIDGNGNIGQALYTIPPSFQLDSPQNNPGVSVDTLLVDATATRNHNLSLGYDAVGRIWSATDSVSNAKVIGAKGATELTINGIKLKFSGIPTQAVSLTLNAYQRPASSIQMTQSDPNAVAAGALFRVTAGSDNTGNSAATVTYSPLPTPTGGPASINSVFSQAYNDNEAVRFQSTPTAPFQSIATIPRGYSDPAIQYNELPQGNVDMQVFTRDGRQLLGPVLSETQRESVISKQNGFMPGAGYSAAYLNKSGSASYRGLDLFYGAVAQPGGNPAFFKANNLVDLRDPSAILVASSTPALSPHLPANAAFVNTNALTLNGTPLGALNVPSSGTLSTQNIADWINGQVPANSDVVASVDGDNRLVLKSAKEIRFGMGTAGSSADLARLGFTAGIHVNGQAPEDLLVFQTGVGSGSVSAGYRTGTLDALQAQRTQRLTVTFTTPDSYSITDATTGQELASRIYDSSTPIRYGSLSLHLSTSPQTGDKFTLDGNQDGVGNNENMLNMTALESKKLLPAGKTIREGYNDVVTDVGNISNQAQIAQQAMTVVNQQAVEARDKVSGVNLDNEAADLIRFQQAYQAAAKTMQIASQMFDSIIQLR